jgi:hypothetical protein
MITEGVYEYVITQKLILATEILIWRIVDVYKLSCASCACDEAAVL